MEKQPKKPSKKGAEKPVAEGPEGEKPIGPGVFKRARRDPASEPAADLDLPGYTPSEQVFRRR